MSTKTLRKRIALVAVSALGAGMLSLVAVPAANAGVAASSGALLGSTNVLDVLTNGGSYAAGNTIATSYSQGLVAGSVLGSTTTQTATMYSNGAITVATAATASSSGAAQKISVTGGTIVATGAVASSPVVSADSRSVTATATNSARIIASIKPTAAGTTLVISGYDDSSAASNWKVTVTVVAPGVAGSFSATYSNIALVTSSSDTPDSTNIDDAGAAIAENNSCVYLYYSLADAVGGSLTSANTLIATASAGFSVGLGSQGTLAVATGNAGTATNRVYVCQDGNNTNKPVSGTVKLSVDGVDVATKTVTVVGQLAKITVSEDEIAIRNFAGGSSNTGLSSTVYGSAPYGAASAGDSSWVPSHSYMGYDSAGNTVPVTAAIVTSTLDAQVTSVGQNQPAAPRNANVYLRSGGLTFACADTSGSNAKLQVKATAADTTTIYSNVFNVTCAGSAVNYTASSDKTSYSAGDVMTVTVNFKDKSGKPINDYAKTSATSYVGTIASGAIKASVAAPAAGDYAVAGVAKYKYILDQTGGNYSVSVDFPLVNNTSYNQAALTMPVTIASTGTSNTEVLAAIVKLIASINKQIAALQKALLKK